MRDRCIQCRDATLGCPEETSVKIEIVVGGRGYEVEAEIEGGHELLRPPGNGHEAGPVQSKLVPTAPRPQKHSEGHADESKVCRSPVAGIVVRVCAQPGEQLQSDDLLVVLEAMKMETSVTSTIAGRVRSINIAPGDGVKLHQILVEFE
jgi:methylmalonyl-CoA carboxyltransferase 1.3S subunit